MKKTTILLLALNLCVLNIFAQGDIIEAELALKAQNPIADMISMPLQLNTTYRIGESHNYTQNILNFQPVIPIGFEKFNIITRTIIPFVSQPNTAGGDNTNGLGDMNITAFFSPNKASTVTWGFGPVFQLPTATSAELGSQKFGLGLSFVLIATQEKWVYGFLINNIWTTDALRTENKMLLQPIVNYNLPKAWYLVTSPLWQANWHATDGNQWLMPLGAGIGKIIKIGKTALNINAHAYYNVKRQDYYWGKWQSRVQVALLFPK